MVNLGTIFFGNTLAQLLLFAGVVLLSIFGTRLVYYVFEKIFKALTSKTKTTVDDMIVEALRGPVILAVVQLGLTYGRGLLTLSERALNTYNQVLDILLIINITWLIIRIADTLLAYYISPHTDAGIKMDTTVYPIAKRLMNFFIYVIGIIFIIDALGYQVTSLLAGLGIGGLALALAAQDVVGNMFGGIAVVTDKPFKVGDRILVAGNDGFVKEIGLRTTIIETFDKQQVIIPNKTISNEVLMNISREPSRRVKQVLGVVYSTPTKKMEKAKKILADIVKKNESTDDKALVHFVEFNSSSLDIQLIYWIKDLDNILNAKDEINFEIKKAFEKEKIEFAYPSQTIYLEK